MISIEALNASRDLVAVLSDKNVTLVPAPGSPLEGLTSVTKRDISGGINCLSKIDQMVLDIHGANRTVIENGSVQDDLHSGYLGTNAQVLGTALASHVSHAMSVVLPAVAELHGKLVDLSESEAVTGPRSYQIVPVRSAAIFDISEITEVLEEMGRIKTTADPTLTLDFKEVSDDELLDLLKAGSSSYDDAITSFVAQVGMDMVRYVWREVFSAARSHRNFNTFRADSSKREDLQTIAFLFALRLYSGKDLPEVDGSAGLSRNQYKIQLRTILEVSGLGCYYAWERVNTDDQAGKMIQFVDGRNVRVDARIYERFLTDGGSADAVLGAAIGTSETYAAKILEDKARFEDLWKYQLGIEKSSAAKDQLVRSRREITNYVRNYALTNKDNDPVIAQNSKRIIENVINFVEKVYQPALENLHMLALVAVCTTLFNHTEAQCILDSYNRAVQCNPELSPEQAMDIAMVDYVADYFAEMVHIR